VACRVARSGRGACAGRRASCVFSVLSRGGGVRRPPVTTSAPIDLQGHPAAGLFLGYRAVSRSPSMAAIRSLLPEMITVRCARVCRCSSHGYSATALVPQSLLSPSRGDERGGCLCAHVTGRLLLWGRDGSRLSCYRAGSTLPSSEQKSKDGSDRPSWPCGRNS